MEPFEEEAALLGLLNERAECSNRTKVTKTDGKTESWPDRIIRKTPGEIRAGCGGKFFKKTRTCVVVVGIESVRAEAKG